MTKTKKVVSIFCCLVLLVAVVAGPATIKARAMGVGVATIVIASAFAALAGWGIGTMVSEVVADDIADWMANDLQLWASGQGGTVEDFIPAAGINLTPLGQLLINPVASEGLRSFALWMVDKYGVSAGATVEVIEPSIDVTGYKTLSQGVTVNISSGYDIKLINMPGNGFAVRSSNGLYDLYAILPYGASTSTLQWTWVPGAQETSRINYDAKSGQYWARILGGDIGTPTWPKYTTLRNGLDGYDASQMTDGTMSLVGDTNISIPADGNTSADTNISWGGSIGLTVEQAAQMILDKVAANELSVTVTMANEAVENPAASQTIEDVNELGLPSLGTYFTTRFPFSIPWDVVRAVKLLAAPAEAPYFEVDFLAPLADDVGGWEGDTTIVLDFGQYPIIGQVTRWASLIGFCILLAVATKKLVWTA